jgi:hypothetical protein
VRPVDNEQKLQTLDDQPWDALRPQFRDQFTEFKDRLLRSLKPKTISGLAVGEAISNRKCDGPYCDPL